MVCVVGCMLFEIVMACSVTARRTRSIVVFVRSV